jgi:uncharacterized integral membrane protein (TIGR00698 family)
MSSVSALAPSRPALANAGIMAMVTRWLPGIALCAAISLAAWRVQLVGERVLGRPWLEALVLAIVIGAAVRAAWRPGERWRDGVALCSKQMLELAVALLGESLQVTILVRAGAALFLGIVAVVTVGILAGYALSRLFGLSPRLSLLVACGNAICGNSAIAAVAPLIGAEPDDVASSIAFTAVLGVIVVLLLPLTLGALGMSEYQYGVLAGLTVYAVPQVLAATFPVSALSGQVATMVKLARVLMLGPVVVALSVWHPAARVGRARTSLGQIVPWFIIAFLVLAAARAVGILPDALIAGSRRLTGVLMVLSMAALGLGVDVRVLGRVGSRVTAAVSASLVVLIAASIICIRLIGLR